MAERRPTYIDFANGEIKEIQDSDTLPPALGGGASDFTGLDDTPNSYTSQGGKYVRVNTGETALEFVNPPSGSGDVTGPASSVNNNIVLFDGLTGKAIKDSGVALSSKADATHTHAAGDITSGTMATARLGSGTANGTTFLRGDQTWASPSAGALDDLTDVILSDPGSAKFLRHNGTNWADSAIQAGDLPSSIDATKIADGTVTSTEFQYLGGVTSDIQTQLNGKSDTSHTHTLNDLSDVAITAAATGEYVRYNGTSWVDATIQAADLPSSIDAAKIANGNVSNTEFQYLDGVTSAIQTQLDGKQATLTNGFGLTGTTTKAVSLTTAEAFCTQETTLNAATYADITGASISLAAGTWVILATINGSSQTTTATVLIAAITDGSNNLICEGAQHIVAGTATVRTWGNVTLSAIVSPGSTTTYKLRGARGTTTQTGNCIVSDGTGLNTTNNVSNNSDKSTSIRAFRIA